jgi:hypothetical protein
MAQIATLADAAPRRVQKPIRSPDGVAASHVFRSDIIAEQKGSSEPDTPNSKLIEQPPGSVLRPHFHCVDQFQVVVRGSGLIGKHEVAPLTVHFAAAYTGYGPIHAGEQGLDYLVFRLGVDTGAAYLPESRDAMKPVPRQYVLSATIPLPPLAGDGDAPAAHHESPVIAVQPNGLGASLLLLPPGDTFEAAAAPWRGAFIHVLGGGVTMSGTFLQAGTCIALAPGESAQLCGAAFGAQLLRMQFPGTAA